MKIISFYLFLTFLATLGQIANSYGQFGLGRKLQEKAGSLLKDKLAEKTKEKAESYDTSAYNYSVAYLDKAESAEAKAENQSLIKAANFFLNDENLTELDKARKLYDVGKFNYDINKFFLSETYLQAAKIQYESLAANKEPNYIRTIGLLGLLYSKMNRFKQAETYFNQAMDLWIQYDDEKAEGYYAELNNLAVLKLQEGKFADAEERLRKFGSFIQANKSEKSLEYCIYLNNLSILYQSVGRLNQALQYNQQCLSLAKDILEETSSTYLGFLTNHAVLEQENGDLAVAEAIFKEALEIQSSRAKFNRKSDTDYAHMQQNIAGLYRLKGNYKAAEDALETALEIYKSKYGENHLSTAAVQSDLGDLYRIQNKNEQAKNLLEAAFFTKKNKLNEQHPKVILAKENLAQWYWQNNDLGTAAELYLDVIDQQLNLIVEFFPAFSDSEKTKYWDVLKPSFDRYFNFIIQNREQNPQLLEQLVRIRLLTKGVLLNSSTNLANDIKNESSPEIRKLYLQWVDQKKLLASTFSMSDAEIEEQNLDIDSLQYAINKSEQALSKRSQSFIKSFNKRNDDIRMVTNKLDQSALIEIIQLPKYEKELLPENQYVYLIFTKDSPLEVLVEDEGSDLENKFFAYYNNVIQNKLSDQLSYKVYWRDLAEVCTAHQKIYISNDGIFNQINLNSIRKPSGRYVIQDKEIIYIGHPNDLLERGSEKQINKAAVLVGDPVFNRTDINPLPGTKKEIDQITNSLKNQAKVVAFTGEEANEKNLRAVKRPQVLHIASHGFFIQDKEMQPDFLKIKSQFIADNPMLKSGILLSGIENEVSDLSNKSFAADNNGVLTAYEAIQMDLTNTELVVLSACETARGDLKSGEGVYGLQRSFIIAGAQNLVMSLWKVEDEATQRLMTEFYKNTSQLPKQEAFRKAQLALLSDYKHPYYWGAFMFYSK